jgi:putative FmdB family regulatory protein
MPFYTFKCPECSKVKDVLQGMNDEAPICKDCSTAVPRHIFVMKRVFKDTGKPQFKGDGFYETDYKKKKEK